MCVQLVSWQGRPVGFDQLELRSTSGWFGLVGRLAVMLVRLRFCRGLPAWIVQFKLTSLPGCLELVGKLAVFLLPVSISLVVFVRSCDLREDCWYTALSLLAACGSAAFFDCRLRAVSAKPTVFEN